MGREVIKRIVAALGGGGIVAVAVAVGGTAASAISPHAGSAAGSPPETVYVLDQGNGTVLPMLASTGKVLPAIHIGVLPSTSPGPPAGFIAVTPDGGRAYAVNPGLSTVTAINTLTNKAIATIRLGKGNLPVSLAISPDGKTGYVLEDEDPETANIGVIVPFNIATGTLGSPIPVGTNPIAMVFSRDSRSGYVLDSGEGQARGVLVRIDLATNLVTGHVQTGIRPEALAITPDDNTILVVDRQNPVNGIGNVLPVRASTVTAGKPITVGWVPTAIEITPTGQTAYVLDTEGAGAHGSSQGAVTPVTISTRKAGRPVSVGIFPLALAITPAPGRVYALNTTDGAVNGNGTVTPIRIPSDTAAASVKVGRAPDAIVASPDERTIYVANGISGTVTEINTLTSKVERTIRVGPRFTADPVALAIVG
jgi:YVTN family beta-propeller protein